MTGDEIVKRKARKTGFAKSLSKMSRKSIGLVVPLLRYSIIPAMLYFTVYHTEPAPTLMDLLNPLF